MGKVLGRLLVDTVWRIEHDSLETIIAGSEFEFDDGQGAEFEAGDISEYGGAAGGDAVLDDEPGE